VNHTKSIRFIAWLTCTVGAQVRGHLVVNEQKIKGISSVLKGHPFLHLLLGHHK
jgi:hypothetical protein